MRLRPAPRDVQAPAEETGYVTTGHPRGDHRQGEQLAADERVVQAMNRDQEARDARVVDPAAVGVAVPDPLTFIPPGYEVIVANQEWEPETFILEPGDVTLILGRDPQRETVEVGNWSGNGQAVYLTRRKPDADRIAQQQGANPSTAVLGGSRYLRIRDGDHRTFTHTAAVYACLPAGAAGPVIVDVSAERRTNLPGTVDQLHRRHHHDKDD